MKSCMSFKRVPRKDPLEELASQALGKSKISCPWLANLSVKCEYAFVMTTKKPLRPYS